MTNTFSDAWFRTFLDPIPQEHTDREIAFVERHLSVLSFPRLLDLCCGSGRHTIPLAARGYQVTGVDTDHAALARAAQVAPPDATVNFLVGDMRRLDLIGGTYDAAINLWHSFGFEDDAGNRAVLEGVRARLRPNGRAIVDLYNRAHFLTLPLTETSERGGHRVHTVRTWSGNRLHVDLRYDGADHIADSFEWRLYDPQEFTALAASAGFRVLLSCAWFTDTMPASAEHGRMQFVLESVSPGTFEGR
ncbi:MAG TPA: class I SAM-dependent methyltransferase [Gemmatimonadaceae bacterium]|nr:class I SAM-dependent methyltransferase [Gemmatimonadaceae bacterium]